MAAAAVQAEGAVLSERGITERSQRGSRGRAEAEQGEGEAAAAVQADGAAYRESAASVSVASEPAEVEPRGRAGRSRAS